MPLFTCPRCAKSLRAAGAFCPRCGLALPSAGKRPLSPHDKKRLTWIMVVGGVVLIVATLLVYTQSPQPPWRIPGTFTPMAPTMNNTMVQTFSMPSVSPSTQQVLSTLQQNQEQFFPQQWISHQVRVPVMTPVYVHTSPFDEFQHRGLIPSYTGPFDTQAPPAGQQILVGPDGGKADTSGNH